MTAFESQLALVGVAAVLLGSVVIVLGVACLMCYWVLKDNLAWFKSLRDRLGLYRTWPSPPATHSP